MAGAGGRVSTKSPQASMASSASASAGASPLGAACASAAVTASLASTISVPSTSRASQREPGSTATRPRSRSADPSPPDCADDSRSQRAPATTAATSAARSAPRSRRNGSDSLERREVSGSVLTRLLL